MAEPTDVHPDPERRWRNRRRMAWISLWAGLMFPLLAYLKPEIMDIAGAYYLFVGTVVGAYIGFSTVDDKWQR